jgi:hypothetical protein
MVVEPVVVENDKLAATITARRRSGALLKDLALDGGPESCRSPTLA